MLKHKLCIAPWKVANTVIDLYRLKRAAIVQLWSLLRKQARKSILLCKRADRWRHKLEEDLEISARYFPCFVDFLPELLQKSAYVALEELCIVCF